MIVCYGVKRLEQKDNTVCKSQPGFWLILTLNFFLTLKNLPYLRLKIFFRNHPGNIGTLLANNFAICI